MWLICAISLGLFRCIPGQTSVSLVIDPVQASDLGNYKVEVWDSESLLTSDTAVLS